MKKSMTEGCTLLILVAAVLFANAAPAIAQKQPVESLLTLRLELSKTSVVLGEPLYANAHLRNESADELQIAVDLNPSAGYITVEVTGPNGGPHPFVPLAIADLEVQPKTLSPGGELAAVFPLFFGGRGWTFDATGSYRLVAVLDQLSGPALRSDPVTVEIHEGDGAGRYLFQTSNEDILETGKFLVWQRGDHLRRAHATLKEIIAAHPESPLADYAHLAFGLNLSQPFRDYSVGRVRPVQSDEALDQLLATDQKVLPQVLRVRRELGLARTYIALGRSADARRSIEAARENADGRKVLQELIEKELEVDPSLSQSEIR